MNEAFALGVGLACGCSAFAIGAFTGMVLVAVTLRQAGFAMKFNEKTKTWLVYRVDEVQTPV